MARLARYAHISPDQFGRMTPAQSHALGQHVDALVDDEWQGWIELAKLIAMSGRG